VNGDNDVNTDCVGAGFTCCEATLNNGASAICVDDTNGN